jgi:hypothetical protein
MPEDGTIPDQPADRPPDRRDDAYALSKDPSLVDQVWIMTRIIGATLLILLGFALVVGLVFRLT